MRTRLAVILCLPLALTGCALSPTAAPSPDQGLSIQGVVHGGQQPISGAHVYMFAANTTGYGGVGIAASSSNLSVSKLNGSGFVITDSGGNFSITGDYTCTPNTQVYLYSIGGNPGLSAGTNNAAAGLMAALGNCPSSGNFLTATPYVVVNEVSTIAAAYAFGGFATDATHVSSSGTTLAQTGIQNAFANAGNLAALSTGAALATTPNGFGIVPRGEIYALADILAACINTDGTLSGPTNPTPCYTLLHNATSDGTAFGTVPADTATAAINIAHHPGANVANLFGLVGATPPFATAFTQPNDFTLGIQFTGGGVDDPNALAIDGAGNVWMTNGGNNTVTELSSLGSPATGSPYTSAGFSTVSGIAIDTAGNAWVTNNTGGTGTGSITKITSLGSVGTAFTNGGLSGPYGIAVDGSNNVWIANNNNTANSVTELSSAGATVSGSPFTAGGLSRPRSVAIDKNGNVWVANQARSSGNYAITELTSAGAAVSGTPFIGGGLNTPLSIAIDSQGNAWVADSGGLTPGVSEFSSAGSALSGSGYVDDGGNSVPNAVALDGASNVWVANNAHDGTIVELSNSGTAISPATGYVPASTASSWVGIAVDGSGDVWIADPNATQMTEVIGAAAPVVTPLSAGAANNTLGSRP